MDLRSAARRLEQDEHLTDEQRAAILKELQKRKRRGKCPDGGGREGRTNAEAEEDAVVDNYLQKWRKRGTQQWYTAIQAQRKWQLDTEKRQYSAWIKRYKTVDKLRKQAAFYARTNFNGRKRAMEENLDRELTPEEQRD
jgi:flagellar motility protein MotE (MotC chaperone)